MTKAQAYRVLGMSSSVGRGRAELLYRQKCHELRLQMMPGMPAAARQKAQAKLAQVNAAWQVVRAPSPAQTTARKTPRKQPTGPAPVHLTPYHKAQSPGKAWEQMASALPFPELVTVILVIVVLVLAIVTLLRHL